MRSCRAISWFSSILTLTRRTAPLASFTTFSRRGPSCLHGPHHGAQKIHNDRHVARRFQNIRGESFEAAVLDVWAARAGGLLGGRVAAGARKRSGAWADDRHYRS